MKERDFYKKLLGGNFAPDFDRIEKLIENGEAGGGITETVGGKNRIKIRRGGLAAICAAVCIAVFCGAFLILAGNDSIDTADKTESISDSSVNSIAPIVSDDSSDSNADSIAESNTDPDDTQPLKVGGLYVSELYEQSLSVKYVRVADISETPEKDVYGLKGEFVKYRFDYVYDWKEYSDTEGIPWIYSDSGCETYFPLDSMTLEKGKEYLIFTGENNKPVNSFQGAYQVEGGKAFLPLVDTDIWDFNLSKLYFLCFNDGPENDLYQYALKECRKYVDSPETEYTLSQPVLLTGTDGENIYAAFFILSDEKITAAFTVTKTPEGMVSVKNQIPDDDELNSYIGKEYGFIHYPEKGETGLEYESLGHFWQEYDGKVSEIYNMGDTFTAEESQSPDEEPADYGFLKDAGEEYPVYSLTENGDSSFISRDGAIRAEYEVHTDSEGVTLLLTYYNDTDYDLSVFCEIFQPVIMINTNDGYRNAIAMNPGYEPMAAHSLIEKTYRFDYSDCLSEYYNNGNNHWNDSGENSICINTEIRLQIEGADGIYPCTYRTAEEYYDIKFTV